MRRFLHFVCAALVLSVFAVVSVRAQDDFYEEYDGPLEVVVARQVQFRVAPSTNRTALRLLAPGTRLRLLELPTRRGYHRVAAPDGRRGWVWAENVRAVEEPAAPVNEFEARAPRRGPCHDARVLGDCPASGCAEEGSADEAEALLNEMKRGLRMTGTRARLLTFPQLVALQERATELVGQGPALLPAERAKLRPLGEGRLSKVVGFLSNGNRTLEPAGPESVNCRLPDAADNDIHVSISPEAGMDELDGIVVEMTPQARQRLAGTWTRARLKRARSEGRRVMAVGQLFYDNKHQVRKRPDRIERLKNQPKRISLWELHPVTEFYVCTRANNACNPSRTAQWTKLENFPERP